MKMIHKLLLPVCLSLFLMLPSCVMSGEKTVFELIGVNPGQITKVVTSGMGNTMRGQYLETTNEETIHALIENFKSVELSYKEIFDTNVIGVDIVIFTFYQEDKELGSFLLHKETNEYNVLVEKRSDSISYPVKTYKVVSGSFDRELMDKVAHAEA